MTVDFNHSSLKEDIVFSKSMPIISSSTYTDLYIYRVIISQVYPQKNRIGESSVTTFCCTSLSEASFFLKDTSWCWRTATLSNFLHCPIALAFMDVLLSSNLASSFLASGYHLLSCHLLTQCNSLNSYYCYFDGIYRLWSSSSWAFSFLDYKMSFFSLHSPLNWIIHIESHCAFWLPLFSVIVACSLSGKT